MEPNRVSPFQVGLCFLAVLITIAFLFSQFGSAIWSREFAGTAAQLRSLAGSFNPGGPVYEIGLYPGFFILLILATAAWRTRVSAQSKSRVGMITTALGLSLVLMNPILGQSSSASLRGEVSDSTGGLLPGVEIRLIHSGTGATRQTVSSGEGSYVFAQLAPGTYRIEAELPGFKTLVQSGIELPVDTPVTLNLQMELGQITETVTVAAESSVLNTTDASVGNAFNEIKIKQLPLLTRNVVELLSLQAGVNQSGQVAGGPSDQNNVTLDGVDVNDQQSPGAFESVLPMPLDSVQEFRVTTVGQNANQGRSGGGQVSLVTKSGTNELHGSLYEFHRNTETAANTFFNNKNGIDREVLLRNQFGFTLGGPIKKDRLFFFVNFEQRKDRSQMGQTREVPSEALKQGILTFRDSEGAIQTLTPEEIRAVDPLGIGISPAMLARFNAVPAGNDPNLGIDRGLNFTGFRFNAPFAIERKTYVAKFDYHLTADGSQTLSWRGTLADFSDDNANSLAQFPGQSASKILNNSRGFATNYTATFGANVVNQFTWGLTRQGLETSGTAPDRPTLNVRSLDEPFNIFTRAFQRKTPAHNLADNITWIQGKHTLQAGFNFRFIRNKRSDFDPAYATFQINNGALFGLGNDIVDRIDSFLQDRSGNPDLTVSTGSRTPVIRAMMGLLGTIADVNATFQFDKEGNVIPQGDPQQRKFGVNEYEFFVQDRWQIFPTLTLTLGLRYSNDTVPWESKGTQVSTSPNLGDFFETRTRLALEGRPSSEAGLLTFDLAGPQNDRRGFFRRDKNNFAPRIAFAWSPDSDNPGFLGRLLGSDGKASLRGGFNVVYNRFGSEAIVNLDSLGSVGLATNQGFPETFDFSTAPRFNGEFPALPAAPGGGGFPQTPPVNFAVLSDTFGIDEGLRTPYSMLINLSYERALPRNMSVEFGYQGRLGRKGLAQIDIAQPLNNMIDPMSGQSLNEALGVIRDLTEGGITQSMIEANPSMVPTLPFVENIFPDLTDFFIDGSASANYAWVQQFIPFSEMDILHHLDVDLCISKFGCHGFFELQTSARPTFFNASNSQFHAFTLTTRKRFSDGLAFDFNYTYSHSIDLVSQPETGAGQFNAVILDAFNPGASKASSDFDIRHQFNTNWMLDLPFGRGRRFGDSVPGWLNQIIGGWQFAGIVRYRTGLPFAVGTGFNFPTNFFLTGNGVPTEKVETGVTINEDGNPGLVPNKAEAIRKFRNQRAGETGPRNLLRGDDFVNTDLTLSKVFQMPIEGHSLEFRWELFNAFNNVNFLDSSDPDFPGAQPFDAPEQFGEFSNTAPPRIMQFALRYSF